MVLGIISVIIAFIVFSFGYNSMTPETVMQQMVQYMVYGFGVVFTCTGFICITIEMSGKKKQTTSSNTETPTTENNEEKATDKQTVCKNCHKVIDKSVRYCKYCNTLNEDYEVE